MGKFAYTTHLYDIHLLFARNAHPTGMTCSCALVGDYGHFPLSVPAYDCMNFQRSPPYPNMPKQLATGPETEGRGCRDPERCGCPAEDLFLKGSVPSLFLSDLPLLNSSGDAEDGGHISVPAFCFARKSMTAVRASFLKALHT